MEIKVPEVGESIYEGLLVKWHKRDGDMVSKDEPLCEIETDKITIELNAEADGVLSVRAKEGKTVKIGSVIGVIDESAVARTVPGKAGEKEPRAAAVEGAVERTSPAARKMAREHELKPEEIKGSGRGGRVTVEDIHRRIETEKKAEKPAVPEKGKIEPERRPFQPKLVRSEPPSHPRPATQTG